MKRFFFLALTALAVLVSAQAREWKLEEQNASFTAADGDVIFGSILPGKSIVVSIADNAKVTLRNAHITYNNNGSGDPTPSSPSLKCLGNAEITIVGKYNMILNSKNYSAIYVPQGKTLKINGTDADSLYVMGGPKAAGIGAYNDVDAGNIQILGGKIEAHGGSNGAGIGGAFLANCGAIDICGGKVKAYGGDRAAGIGSGFDSSKAGYVNITKPAGGATTTVYAEGGYRAAGIGCGCMGTCGVVNISAGTDVTAIKGNESPCSIGLGYGCSANGCGTITIGGTTYPNGVARKYFNYPDIHSINLAMLTEDYIAQDGDILFGKLVNKNAMIQIAANAKITLRNAEIRVKAQDRNAFPGLSCIGDAEITLEGENIVRCESAHKAAIYVPSGKKLEIKGSGKLQAFGGQNAAGIGANDNGYGDYSGKYSYGGTIIIRSGIIEACGGKYGAGIGGANQSHCAIVEIFGGNVTAIGGNRAAGIGTGFDGSELKGMINIQGGIVKAVGGYRAAGIGCGCMGKSASITIGANVNSVTAIKGDESPCSIGKGYGDIGCGTITIGGTVYPNGIDRSPYTFPSNKIVDLGSVSGDFTLQHGEVLTGTLNSNIKIQIADGAFVTLRDVTINGTYSSNILYAGITCLGDANITLEGTNVIKSPGEKYPAIFVPDNKSLVINGKGSLKAMAKQAAGIGAAEDIDCGHILIDGGTIEARSQKWGAGIGGAHLAYNGHIYIRGGNVTAIGGTDATGIGAGFDSGRSGNIFLQGGTIKATGKDRSPAIGAACMSTAYNVYLYSGITSLKAEKGDRSPNTIGKGYGDASQFGNIYINDQYYARGIDRSPYYYPSDNVIDLWEMDNNFTVRNGETLTGRLGSDIKISIAAGATIYLQDVDIDGTHEAGYPFAGLTCLGSARIILKGNNKVAGFSGDYPAIFVPQNYNLTFAGSGSLEAISYGNSAAIGAAVEKPCGNIFIEGGVITAYTDPENGYGAGIGGAYYGYCGDITISGGEVTAYGGDRSAAIGASYASNPCGNITIDGGVVYAWGGMLAPGIGAAVRSVAGDVTIKKGVRYLMSAKGETCTSCGNLAAPYAVGTAAKEGNTTSTCGKVRVQGNSNYITYGAGIPVARYIYPEGATDPNGEEQTLDPETVVPVKRAAKTIDLDTLSGPMLLINGDVLTGTLNAGHMLSIEPDAEIALNVVTINGTNNDAYKFAALNCLGNAKIKLVGTNALKGFHEDYPAIFVPEGSTLTIKDLFSDGKLYASSNGYGAGIGGGYGINCGNIVIESGSVYPTGGRWAAAIGSGANGASCGNITVAEHGTYIYAVKGTDAACTIGKGGSSGSHGTIKIGTKTYADGVTTTPYTYPEPVTGNVLNLNNLAYDYTITDDMIITGTLNKNVKIVIDKVNAKVTLRNVTINGGNSSSTPWAGITCLKDNIVINLEGDNVIKSFNADYPAIYNKYQIVIQGAGKLTATGGENAAGIGASRTEGAGMINIWGGTVIATGGNRCAGIGASNEKSCGAIGIGQGAKVTAKGGAYAPAIGAPSQSSASSKPHSNRITWGNCSLNAQKGSGATYSIDMGTNIPESEYIQLPNADNTIGIMTKHPIAGNFTFNSSAITDYTVQDGDQLCGNLSQYHLTVAKNATVKLERVDIIGVNKAEYDFAGLTCMGNNTLKFMSLQSHIKGFKAGRPGIEIKSGWLILESWNEEEYPKLYVSTNGGAPAIGPAAGGTCDYIRVNLNTFVMDGKMYGSELHAEGGLLCPAIGAAGNNTTCGNIYIKNGIVEAIGGDGAPGIGASLGAHCGVISLYSEAHTTAMSNYATYSVGGSYLEAGGTAYSGTCDGIKLYSAGSSKDVSVGIEDNPFYWPEEVGIAKHRCQNGEVLSGEVPYRITIAPNATIYLNDAVIGGQEEFEYYEPGIYCEGNTTIVLSGHSTVQSFNKYFPGIFVPEGYRLTIRKASDNATVEASSKGDVVYANMVKKVNGHYVVASGNPKMAAGIGGCYAIDKSWNVTASNCGDIIIESGHVIAYGGAGHPGIGGGESGNCGSITILGGTVEAYGGTGCPGIGAGSGGSCGTIRMTNQVTRVQSNAGENAPYSVGEAEANTTSGISSVCENIMVGGEDYGTGILDRIFIYEPTDEERKEDIEIVDGTFENETKIYKVMSNGQLLIIRGNQVFTITGQRVQ